MAEFWAGTDAVGRQLSLRQKPERVVSLVPSQTEMLFDFGLGERLVGRTRYCIHPKDPLQAVVDVGGTKRVDLEKIRALSPDLILAEKEENPREMVEALSELAPVYVTDVVSIPSALEMMESVGRLVGEEERACGWRSRIAQEMEGVRGIFSDSGERVLYLIWRKPWMAAGTGTFIHSCLEWLGLENAAAPSARYPELSETLLRERAPDRVLLSSEPFPFRAEHAEEIRAILPSTRVTQVDGELFSWYGTRMLRMPAYWRGLRAEVAR